MREDVHAAVSVSDRGRGIPHRTPAIQRRLQRHPRSTFHYTPIYSSWMNLVERWFAELTTKWLRARRPPQRCRPRQFAPQLDRQLERASAPLHLAQDR
ncbi:MAG: transposase [Chloroflexi bacterium]|nr:transposase [Chloroflexota bacterium]